MEIISIRDVKKTFAEGRTAVRALDGISLSINKGEVFGLLGANGAGKTTLISILAGLLSSDSGSISIFGMDIAKDMDKIKPRINIVSGFTMIGMQLNVYEYLKYFAMLYDIKDREKKIREVIRLFGLSEKEKIEVRELSSGYKQRLLMAKAFLNDPEIIFMDEPTVGLDVTIAVKIRKIIADLKKKGTTIIFTSHNLEEVEQLCDRITLISKGNVIAQGTIEEIKERIRNNRIIEISCKRTDDFLVFAKKMKEVKKARISFGKVIIEANSIQDVEKIMKKAINSDHIIFSIRKIEPTLEEAFINIINGRDGLR